MKKLAISTLVAVTCTTSAQAQIMPTQPYLMAFHACDRQVCLNPSNHRVYLAESSDGVAWTMVPGWVDFSGSVPDVIQRGRTLYIYVPGRVARYNLDTGVSDVVFAQVSGLPSGVPSDWVDPSVFIDSDGRLVLFMLYAPFGSGDPAGCGGAPSCTKHILSATEVPGSNGRQFVVDPGDRATIALSGTSTASDPDIFFDGTQYVLYISRGPSTSVWTSPTLRGTYTQSMTLPNGLLSNNTGGVPAGYFDPSTMQYWTYAHVGQAGVSVIRRAVHSGLSEQLGEASWTTVMTGPSIGFSSTTSVESPSFTLLTPPEADLSVTKSASPDPVVTGSNLTYVLAVSNGGPDRAIDVNVTDQLPPETAFVSCDAAGGVCGGVDNSRTAAFSRIGSGGTRTVSLVTNVACSVPDDSRINNTANVSAATLDPNTLNNLKMVTTIASNPAPTITDATVDRPTLWPPNHRLQDVRVDYTVSDNCPVPPDACSLSVSSNEPDDGLGDGDVAPDSEIVDAHKVRLRAERAGTGSGRIYSIAVTCTDSGGASSTQIIPVSVPHSLR
jgi:uncharacterized repeat protein (TIGR01451 family)